MLLPLIVFIFPFLTAFSLANYNLISFDTFVIIDCMSFIGCCIVHTLQEKKEKKNK